MANKFLTLIVLAALGWAFVNPRVSQPLPRSVASRSTTSEHSTASRDVADSTVLEAHKLPVPLTRNVRVMSTAPTSPDSLARDAEAQAPDDRDIGTAKAAIEADGYKRVSVLGKSVNGTWRAKAYRGQTEVELTVDSTGSVSAR